MSLGSRKPLKAPFLILFVLGALIAWLGFGQHGFIHLYRVEKERQAYIQKNKKLAEENQALFEEIQRLRTDPKYVGYIARRELGLIKRNEVIYRFTNGKKQGNGSQAASGNKKPDTLSQGSKK